MDDGSCSRPGCIDPSSAAHDAAATFHVPCLCSGTCSLSLARCRLRALLCCDWIGRDADIYDLIADMVGIVIGLVTARLVLRFAPEVTEAHR